MTIVFNWYGPESSIAILQVIPSYLGLRVIFTGPVVNDDELVDPRNYLIEALD
jgi:hypothetical protein